MKVENPNFGNQELRETKRMMNACVGLRFRCVESLAYSEGYAATFLSLSLSPSPLYYARTINLFTIINTYICFLMSQSKDYNNLAR